MNLTHPLTIYDKRVVLDPPEDEHELVDTYLGFRGRIAEGDTPAPIDFSVASRASTTSRLAHPYSLTQP